MRGCLGSAGCPGVLPALPELGEGLCLARTLWGVRGALWCLGSGFRKALQGCKGFILQGRGWGLDPRVGLRSSSAIKMTVVEPKWVQKCVGVTAT